MELANALIYNAIWGASGAGGGWDLVSCTREQATTLLQVTALGDVLYKVSESTPSLEQIKSGYFGFAGINGIFGKINSDSLISDDSMLVYQLSEENKVAAFWVFFADVPEEFFGVAIPSGIYFTETVISQTDECVLVYPMSAKGGT